MRQSVPWSVKGVGPDAREAAKDLARRSGMTLGQWLNAMISEQTGGEGREESGPEEEASPLAALAARLDDMNRQPAAPAGAIGRAGTARDTWAEERNDANQAMERLRATEARTASLLEALVRRHGESEARTVQLIENLAQVNRTTESKTAQALAAVTKWIEAAERAPKENARAADRDAIEAVRAIAGRLDQIEGRLPQIDAVPRPVKAAIDRLEARLTALAEKSEPTQTAANEMMRTAAELERRFAALAEKVAAPARPAPAPEPAVDQAARIEARLASMLETMDSRPAPGRASLDRAISQIGTRQKALEEAGLNAPVWPPRPATAVPGRNGIGEGEVERGGGNLDAVRDQIAGLTQEIAQLRAAGRATPDLSNDPTLAELRREIASISASLPGLAPTQGLRALEGRIEGLVDRVEDLRHAGASSPALKALEQQLADIVRHVSELHLPDLAGLSQNLKSISSKLDLVAAQGVDPSALVRLQKQTEDIRNLVSQTARPDDVDGLAARIDDLAARLDLIQETMAQPRPEAPSPAFAELTARLEQIQQSLALPLPQGPSPAFAELSARLDRLQDTLARPQAALPTKAYDDLAARLDRVQDALSRPHEGMPALAMDDLTQRLDRLQETLQKPQLSPSPGALDEITARLDRLQEAVSKPQPAISGLPLHELTERLDRMNAVLSTPQALASHAAFDALAKRLDRVQETLVAPQPLVATASLEAMIGLLAERLEKAQQPDADDQAFEALERQITRIAEKLEGQTSDAPDLSGIQRTLGELMANLEQTRNAAIDAADDAALRAVRETMAQLPARGGGEKLPDDVRQHLEALRQNQDVAGRKTQTTLEAVNATLERLAERLNTLEGPPPARPVATVAAASFAPPPAPAAAAVSATPAAAPVEAAKPPAPAAIAAAPVSTARAEAEIGVRATPIVQSPADMDMSMDMPLEPGSGGPSNPQARSALDAAPVKASMPTPTGNDPRSVFIAAARRAAQAAAAEAASPADKPGDARPEVQPSPTAAGRDRAPRDRSAHLKGDVRTSVSALQGRTLLQRNKRPILFGMAAVTLALGSLACWTALTNENAGIVSAPVTATDTPAAPKADVPAAPPALAPPATTPPAPAPAAKPQASLFSPQPETTASITPPGGTTRSIGLPSLGGGIPSLTDAMAQTAAQANEAAAAAAARPILPEKLETALKAGDPRASYDAASRLVSGNSPPADLKAAAQLYQLAAAKGFAPAQYRLGSMYEKGIGVDKDVAMAKTWYERAAGKGNIKAMHNMAVLYAEGAFGGKADYATAGQWFRQAAEHGLRDSQYNLAILVTRGLGTTANPAEGYKWLSLAAAQGDTDAGKKRDEIGQRLDAETRAKMDRAAQAFVPKLESIMAKETTLPAMSWTDEQPKGA